MNVGAVRAVQSNELICKYRLPGRRDFTRDFLLKNYMMKMKDVLKLILVWCVFKCCNSEEIFDKAFEEELDKFIEKTMDCRHIPGLTLSVVKGIFPLFSILKVHIII